MAKDKKRVKKVVEVESEGESESKSSQNMENNYGAYIGGLAGVLGAYGAYRYIPGPQMVRIPLTLYSGLSSSQMTYNLINEPSKIQSQQSYLPVIPIALGAMDLMNEGRIVLDDPGVAQRYYSQAIRAVGNPMRYF
jgi:hypothetical protein